MASRSLRAPKIHKHVLPGGKVGVTARGYRVRIVHVGGKRSNFNATVVFVPDYKPK